MNLLKRIHPRMTAHHWWKVMYRDRWNKEHTLGTINSREGALDWAERMNEEPGNRHYWAEPSEDFPVRAKP